MARENFSFWDFDKYKELHGELIGRYPSIGKFQRAVFVFRREGGGVVHIWSWVQIHNLLNGVPFGTKLKLKYLGMKEMPNKKGRLYKDFSVEIISAPEKNPKTKK
jgi:hypothetical protein